jgi:hypothetical protein
VPLPNGSVATIPTFDVKALLIAFLNDLLQMHDKNFASNFDIFTGKAKLPTSTLDEIGATVTSSQGVYLLNLALL